MYTPRDYQHTGIENAKVAWSKDIICTLLNLATGLGKTRCAAWLAKYMMQFGRIMVIANRDELLYQAEKVFKQTCGVTPVFEKAGDYSPESSLLDKPQIVISSVQTQNSGTDDFRRMCRFDPNEFSMLWIDEADLALAPTYIRLINHYKQNPNLRILLVTATAKRSDGRGLKEICDHVSLVYDLRDGIRGGWLVPVRMQRAIIEGLDFAKVKTKGDDFNEADLEAMMLQEKPLHGIVHATLEAAYGLEIGYLETIRDLDMPDRILAFQKRVAGNTPLLTLGFSPGVEHAERLAEICNRWIPGIADSISYKTKQDDRKRLFRNFETGELRMLFNCGITTRGYDNPNIELISMARPSKSWSLVMQMLGRGTRPLESIASLLGECTESAERREIIERSNKPMCRILDFVGNSGRHKLISPIDILGESKPQRVLDRAAELIDATGMNPQDAIDQAGRDIALEQEAESAMSEMEAEKVDADDEIAISYAAQQRMGLVATAQYSIRQVSAFDDSKVEAPQVNSRFASPGQIEFLRKFGVDPKVAAGYSSKQAGAVITSMREKRCTIPQAKYLRRLGLRDAEIHSLNFEAASARISQMKGVSP